MNTTINNVDKKGKFHSVDIETYKKLRKVRFFMHVEKIQQSRHDRWSRKLPHNRVRWVRDGDVRFVRLPDGDKPTCFWNSVPWEEPEQCPLNLGILYSEYKNAQKSYDDPNKVIPMKLDEDGLDAMITQLYAWSDRAYGFRR